MSRKYSNEFKRDAVQYLKDHPDMDKRTASKHLGVPYETLYGWYKLYRRENNPDAYDEQGKLTDAEKEVIRLRRELRDAQDALEILKKAISILGD
ncbi:MAG: transposase [Parasporobacterium sp.]|nr:transposase [Parasporobacterium sp.]